MPNCLVNWWIIARLHQCFLSLPLLCSLCLGCAAAALLQIVVSFILLSCWVMLILWVIQFRVILQNKQLLVPAKAEKLQVNGNHSAQPPRGLRELQEKKSQETFIIYVELWACMILSCWNLNRENLGCWFISVSSVDTAVAVWWCLVHVTPCLSH